MEEAAANALWTEIQEVILPSADWPTIEQWEEIQEAARSTVQAADDAESLWTSAIDSASVYSQDGEPPPPPRSPKGKERMFPLPPALQPKPPEPPKIPLPPPMGRVDVNKRAFGGWANKPFTTLLRNVTVG